MPDTLRHDDISLRSSLGCSGTSTRRLRITLRGGVQGLGVRPAIARLAQHLGLAGEVGNSTAGLSIEIEGDSQATQAFQAALPAWLPTGARVVSQTAELIEPTGATDFRIVASTALGALTTMVPADKAICQQCLAEAREVGNRRQGFAFTTCTICGPRYALIDSMPYDRVKTSMQLFPLCDSCQREYADPNNRRYHSQTNSCPQCGPRLWLDRQKSGNVLEGHGAVAGAAADLRFGRVVALRGVGGYQLLVDATSPSAVRDLRTRKQRFHKPLAVMVSNLAEAERLAILSPGDRAALCSPANPIVVVRSRPSVEVAREVACELDTIGLFLPTTALHDDLLRGVGTPLVVTSANVDGEPLAYSKEAGYGLPSELADACLDHDRPVVRPIDDSVVRVIAGRTATLRLARGLAPLPLRIKGPAILALGGHQKSAFALSNGAQAALGPHVGDLDGEACRSRYLQHLTAMCRLYDAQPELLVVDQHPDYFTTRWAAAQSTPIMTVQHHHAHVAAAMLEYELLDEEVLGVAWDGTGYGSDGTIWGGEFLRTSAADSCRVASIRPFALPGGERAVREPWRLAVALVYQAVGPEHAAALRFPGIAITDIERLVQLLARPRLWPVTSSVGRLFDGIAALALNIGHARYDAHLAMLLESACDTSAEGEYQLPLTPGQPAILDWRGIVARVLAERAQNVAPGTIAMRFHRALAGGIAAVVERNPGLPVVLCGGCFQNRLLTELVVERLSPEHNLFTPGIIPTGDGGLAAGQLAVAAARIAQGWRPCA